MKYDAIDFLEACIDLAGPTDVGPWILKTKEQAALLQGGFMSTSEADGVKGSVVKAFKTKGNKTIRLQGSSSR